MSVRGVAGGDCVAVCAGREAEAGGCEELNRFPVLASTTKTIINAKTIGMPKSVPKFVDFAFGGDGGDGKDGGGAVPPLET